LNVPRFMGPMRIKPLNVNAFQERGAEYRGKSTAFAALTRPSRACTLEALLVKPSFTEQSNLHPSYENEKRVSASESAPVRSRHRHRLVDGVLRMGG